MAEALPPFKPDVEQIHCSARRVVRVREYESFEISTLVTAKPDPNYLVTENVANLQALVIQEVNGACEQLMKDLELEDTKQK